MLRGMSTFCLNSFLARGIFATLIAALLSGCIIPFPFQQVGLVIPAIPCNSEDTRYNIYAAPAEQAIPTIFQYSTTATPVPTPSPAVIEPNEEKLRKLNTARYEALTRLEKRIQRWTTSITLSPDGGISQVKIMVTFLSPEVIQLVYLNELLKNNTGVLDINIAINNAMTQLMERNDLIFLVTALPEGQPIGVPHSISLNINQMKMVNVNKIGVQPTHYDQNLDQSIDMSKDIFGYVYFPMFVDAGQGCVPTLDKVHDTKINIQTSSITIDGAETGLQSWTIDYRPLIETGSYGYAAVFGTPPFDATMFPMPDSTQIDHTEDQFWQDYALFVWGQVILAKDR